MDFLDTPTLGAAHRFVERNPVLLSTAADVLIQATIAAFQVQHPDLVAYAEERKRLLDRCRQIGVGAAFAEERGRSRNQTAPVTLWFDPRFEPHRASREQLVARIEARIEAAYAGDAEAVLTDKVRDEGTALLQKADDLAAVLRLLGWLHWERLKRTSEARKPLEWQAALAMLEPVYESTQHRIPLRVRAFFDEQRRRRPHP